MDEGQDILNMDSLSKLDACLNGGLEAGRWGFFHDANNQSGLCGEYLPDAYEYLNSQSPMRVPLRTNCRNALPILKGIQSTLQADMGNPGVGDGPSVREFSSLDRETLVHHIEQELETLTEKEGFSYGDLVILSHVPFQESLASQLSPRWRQSIVELDAASAFNTTRHSIGFAQIADFKGLESDVVVLIDLPAPGAISELRSLHYVGMSRAKAVLSIIAME